VWERRAQEREGEREGAAPPRPREAREREREGERGRRPPRPREARAKGREIASGMYRRAPLYFARVQYWREERVTSGFQVGDRGYKGDRGVTGG
jgi:hypothetical protein